MNKYIIITLVLIVVILGGLFYRFFLLPKSQIPIVSGKEREITIIARRDKWLFEPESIEAERGDAIIATVINEDDYDHGIAIDAFGVSQRMPANSVIKVRFTVTQVGDFPFYCSVPCGEGLVYGKKRGHFDMVGKIHVK